MSVITLLRMFWMNGVSCDDQAVGQLDQHLGTAVLGRVHAARQVVDRLGGLEQRLRLRVGGLARIVQRRQLIAVLLEVLDGRLVGNGQRHHVAALFAGADLPEPCARRHLRQLLVVAVNVLGVGQLARLADEAAEELERCRHGVRRRQVIHQLGGDPRVLQGLLDLGRVLRVDFLGLSGSLGVQAGEPASPAMATIAIAITFFIFPPSFTAPITRSAKGSDPSPE